MTCSSQTVSHYQRVSANMQWIVQQYSIIWKIPSGYYPFIDDFPIKTSISNGFSINIPEYSMNIPWIFHGLRWHRLGCQPVSYLGDSQHGGPSLRRHGRAFATAAAGWSGSLELERLKQQKSGVEWYIILGGELPTARKWISSPQFFGGLTLLIPFITVVITRLLSGMSHQVGKILSILRYIWKICLVDILSILIYKIKSDMWYVTG